MTQIFTVGHSNKSIDELAALLISAEIETLVDVRSSPWSKYNPQFNERTMGASLEAAGIRYEGRGKNLGGKGVNVRYDATIAELAERAKTEMIAVCCSEGDYRKCHRYEMLTPSFESAGLDVVHLMWDGRRLPNVSTRAPIPPAPDAQMMFDFDVVSFPKMRAGQWVTP